MLGSGLDRVTEIQPQDYVPGGSLRYYCSLCEAACDSSTIRTHIIGLRHRIAFLVTHVLIAFNYCKAQVCV